MEPKNIENPIAYADFIHQLKAEKMTIHQKINSKFNLTNLPAHFTNNKEAREFHAESIAMMPLLRMKIISRNYTGTIDELVSHQVAYSQDRKTNYREPNV